MFNVAVRGAVVMFKVTVTGIDVILGVVVRVAVTFWVTVMFTGMLVMIVVGCVVAIVSVRFWVTVNVPTGGVKAGVLLIAKVVVTGVPVA